MKNTYVAKNKNMDIRKIVIIAVICIVLLVTLLCSFQTINSGEIGLKIRFGKVIETNMKEGFNLKIPYIESIVKMSIKVQKTELETSSASKDLQDVSTSLAVNFRVNPDMVVNLYKNVGKDYENIILQPTIEESVKSVISKYNAEELVTKRNEVSDLALKTLQEKVEKYGIIIDEFNIININFSEEYSNAIEAKQVAEQQLEKAKLEAEAKLVEAEATKQVNDLLKQTLTKEVLIQKFIEKWNGELPTNYAGEDILSIFNLN